MDNRGIKKPLLAISYHECTRCSRWKLTFSNPFPESYLREALKQKQEYKRKLEKRKVLFEKTKDPLEMELTQFLDDLDLMGGNG